MLIYDSQKKFIGIDEGDLKALGFNSLDELNAQVSDFADLFVKTPGYIHNFKHVHWIDFISCATSSEESQAIISVNSKSFKCKLSTQVLYLTQSPSSKSYAVYLNALHELGRREGSEVSADIAAHPTITTITPDSSYATAEIIDEYDTPQESSYEMPLEIDLDSEDSSFDIDAAPIEAPVQEELEVPQEDEAIDLGDLSIDDETLYEEPEVLEIPQRVEESEGSGYHYDPHIASSELGLPLDLIEEFIEDFITQAKEFKGDIYSALSAGEFDKVKILSHKLKGVAANLRVEDALEALSVVNGSSDRETIERHLESFYRSIAKLAGEERGFKRSTPDVAEAVEAEVKTQTEVTSEQEKEQSDSDELYLDLQLIEDADVPQKIEMPELADDEFVSDDEFAEDEIAFKDTELDLVGFENELDAPEILLDEEPLLVLEYSKESAAREIGLTLESYSELFDEFLSESRLMIEAMGKKLQEGDIEGCKESAQKLQSMSESIRVKGLKEELALLMGSTDIAQKDALLQAVQKIQSTISQISKEGA